MTHPSAQPGKPPALTVVFAVTEAGPHAAAGDYFTALELGSALALRFGWHIDYRAKGPHWYDMAGVDVLVAMLDEYQLPNIQHAAPHLVTVAWARNWFEAWCARPWAADYTLLLASSRKAVQVMSERLGKHTKLLRIATNPARFHASERACTSEFDFVFTGSYWQADRDVVAALGGLPRRYRGAIFGKHWEQVPGLAHLNRGFVPYQTLPDVYRQSTVVIDDANHVTKEWGAANSRVFDALAAGCLVFTNSRSVSDEVFDGRLPVYEDAVSLDMLLDRYLADAEARQRLTDDLRNLVLARHSYAHRAMELGLHLRTLRMQGTDLEAATSSKWARLPRPVTQEMPKRKPLPVTPEHLPAVSFVVPLFNHLAETREMLASLQASIPVGLDYEIIFSDDASTDGTVAWLKTLRDQRIKMLIRESNRGYAATNNAGVRLARGELLGLLNNDLLFEPGWLEPMLAVLLSPELKAGLVGNVQYRVADGAVDHAGLVLSPEGQLHHIWTLPNKPYVKALAVSGACILLRKADFEAVGGFDETFVNGCEDIDLCLKLRAAGKAVYVASESRICHHVSLSRKTNTLQDLRNSRHLFARWRPEIKRELSEVWRTLLAAGPQAYADKLSGDLAAEFLATPHVASRVIAERMLRREESCWASKLDSGSKVQESSIKFQGLRFSAEHGAHLLDDSAEFFVDGLRYARNFYVCGRRIDDLFRPMALTIKVNGLQALKMLLKAEHNVNVGLTDPLLLPSITNRFRVEVDGSMLVTHLVIDDRVVDL